MPVEIRGKRYYRTNEAVKMAGVSKSTLFRWIDTGIFKDDLVRDRRGWRLFSHEDVARLKKEACRMGQVFAQNWRYGRERPTVERPVSVKR
jgi:hypothetical protein